MSVDWSDVRDRWESAVEAARSEHSAREFRMKRLGWLANWWSTLVRDTVPVPITGTGGAGKSVLYDALTDATAARGYTLPGPTDDVAGMNTLITGPGGKVKASFEVTVGQSVWANAGTFQEVFEGDAPPSGLIHVVSFGYNKAWEGDTATQLELNFQDQAMVYGPDRRVRRYRLAFQREENRYRELEGFKNVRAQLRARWGSSGRHWLILAVTKSDLYWRRLAAARDYYIPGGWRTDSPFARELRGVVADMDGRIDIAVLPVASCGEAFSINGRPGWPSQLTDSQRDALTDNLRLTIGEFCGEAR